MTNQTQNLTDELYQYLLSVSVRENPVLSQLREEMISHPVGKMQISPEQGQFMGFLLKLMGAKKVIDIGVFTGYSSTVMALAIPDDGIVVGCDISKPDTDVARKYWYKAGVDHKVNLYLAPALETLDMLIDRGEGSSFDFIFIDADKGNYQNYYERSLSLLRQGGVVAIDNILWYGKVADEMVQDKRTCKIRDFNAFVYQDNRVDLSLIPIGDGLSLARKK